MASRELKLQILIQAYLLSFSVSAAAGANTQTSRAPQTLKLPKLILDRSESRIRRTVDAFSFILADKLRSVPHGPGGVVMAPFGGSKIRAFAETDADVLVIVDVANTGGLARVRKDFRDRTPLAKAILAGLSGGMATADVRSTSPISQMIAKLGFEMGVTRTRLSRWLMNQSPVVLIQFEWRGHPRAIVYVQERIRSDSSGLSPLPESLTKIVNGGFGWIYLSADGIGFFNSKAGGNGLVKASAELLRLLFPGGLILLDYPHRNDLQEFEGITFMGPRTDLREWGCTLLVTLSVPVGPTVFGYSGPHPGDEVRLYRKPGLTPSLSAGASAFSIQGFFGLGAELLEPPTNFELEL